jgi:hypothetical protein
MKTENEYTLEQARKKFFPHLKNTQMLRKYIWRGDLKASFVETKIGVKQSRRYMLTEKEIENFINAITHKNS